MQTANELENDQPERRSGEAWYRRVGDLHLLKLKGSLYEMGRQHGELLRAEIAAGPVPYYRDFAERLLGRPYLGPISPFIWPTIQRRLIDRVARGMPAFGHDMLRGIADGAGLPFQEYLEGCTIPDGIVWLVSRAMQVRRPGPAVQHRVLLGLGCSSAIAWGDATPDGALLHGRNFDYHGIEVWPRSAAVIFHEPDVGHRYVSITAAGVGGGGITAMNAAGLTLSVHQHMFSDQAKLGGTPIGLAGDQVMREASSLDEAEAILGRYRPIGCWTYVISDGNTREVLCWEEDPQHQAPRRNDPDRDTFGYANVFLDPALGETEVNLYGSYWRHNAGRHARANALLAEHHGRLDPQAIAGILGDTGSTACRMRDAIANLMTVGSVVFRPSDGAFWVGTGDVPTSRGTYLPFSLAEERFAPELGELEVGADEPPDASEAFACWRRAFGAHLDRLDGGEAHREMKRACELAPDQALFHFLRGLLAVSQNDPGDAELAIDRAIEIGHPDPERLAAFHLWRGRARDLRGERHGALNDYRASLGYHADPPVYAAARLGIKKAYSKRRAKRVSVDLTFADVVWP